MTNTISCFMNRIWLDNTIRDTHKKKTEKKSKMDESKEEFIKSISNSVDILTMIAYVFHTHQSVSRCASEIEIQINIEIDGKTFNLIVFFCRRRLCCRCRCPQLNLFDEHSHYPSPICSCVAIIFITNYDQTQHITWTLLMFWADFDRKCGSLLMGYSLFSSSQLPWQWIHTCNYTYSNTFKWPLVIYIENLVLIPHLQLINWLCQRFTWV